MRKLTVTPAWEHAVSGYCRELRSAGQSRQTLRLRRAHLRSLAHDHRDREPWSLDREDIVAWMASHGWGSNNTGRSYRASIRGFYRWARDSGRASTDPADTLAKISTPQGVPRPAPDDAVDEALATANLRSRMIITVLAFTGIRRSECAKLHTEDLVRDLAGWSLLIRGKGGKERLVPVDDDLAAAIRLMPKGWLFPGRIDGHLSGDYLGRLASRALPGKWTAHTLRHRFASLAYQLSQDIRAVQELLGHASIKTTQIYTYVPTEAMRVAASAARNGLETSGAHRAHDAVAARSHDDSQDTTDLENAVAQIIETELEKLLTMSRGDPPPAKLIAGLVAERAMEQFRHTRSRGGAAGCRPPHPMETNSPISPYGQDEESDDNHSSRRGRPDSP